jgi:hypothetical protein
MFLVAATAPFAALLFFYRVFMACILAGSRREATHIIVPDLIIRPLKPNY